MKPDDGQWYAETFCFLITNILSIRTSSFVIDGNHPTHH